MEKEQVGDRRWGVRGEPDMETGGLWIIREETEISVIFFSRFLGSRSMFVRQHLSARPLLSALHSVSF